MPDFEVFDRTLTTDRLPMVTLLKGRVLSLNRASYAALDRPATVELLWDCTKRIVGIHAVASGVRHGYYVRAARRSVGPYLVSAMAFLRHCGIETPESRRWPAWIENDTVCICLDERFDVVTSNRAGHPRL